MVVAEFSMFPIGKGISLSAYVARCLEIVDRSGLNYRCHAMGTLLEGEYDEVMAVVRECFQALATDCQRVECSLRFDYRQGLQGRLDGKVASVEAHLGREVRK